MHPPEAQALLEEMAVEFHQYAAKHLFLMNNGWPKIPTAVSLLATQMKNPYEDDWGKFKCMMMYL